MEKFVFKIRIILWLILALIIGWLFYKGIVPSGKISYVYNYEKAKADKASWFIQKLTPEERVEIINKTPAKAFGDPIYFALRTPRTFNKAKLTLKYKNIDKLPIIEAGVLVDKKVWRYDLKPIENKIIYELAKQWNAVKENKAILLQREENYNSIEEFLNNLPARKEIALYNYNFNQEFLLSDYTTSNNELDIEQPLRGAWQFYTYIKNPSQNGVSEDLDFNFLFVDINNNKDSDPVELLVYYDNELIQRQNLADDGISQDNNKVTMEREMKLNLANLPEGVYKIELKVNDDIITKKIKTKQSKLAFNHRLWIYKNASSEIELYTDSRLIKAQTINPASLQTIKLFSPLVSSLPPQELVVNETYKQFSIKSKGENGLLVLEKSDVIISGDGVFSFNGENIINPNLKKVVPEFDADEQNVNYILTQYKTPIDEDGWQVAQAEFDLTKAYREFYKYNFIISIPGLNDKDEIDDYILIKEIGVELEGTTLLEKINKLVSF